MACFLAAVPDKRESNAQSAEPSKKPGKSLAFKLNYEVVKLHISGMKGQETANKFELAHLTLSIIWKQGKLF